MQQYIDKYGSIERGIAVLAKEQQTNN
ncbi:MAG TPA: hypothetical protein VGD90_06715 [Sphingobacteriaceae bacterium]